MSDVIQLDGLTTTADPTKRLNEVVIGGIVALTEDGAALVDFPGNPLDNPVRARAVSVLSTEDVGRQVTLLFEDADPARPIVMGAIVEPNPVTIRQVLVQRDDERIELTAEREIVLRCGSASITLTRAGKVLIRGAYVSSHSAGVNKIQGGSVQIN